MYKKEEEEEEEVVRTTSGDGINSVESGSAVAFLGTSKEGGPHRNGPVPRDWMNADVPRRKWMIQIMPPFGVLVHVATKDL